MRTSSDDGQLSDSQRDSDSSDLLESKGEACSTDPDCSGYLRCRSGTCEIPPGIEGEDTSETPRVRFHGKGSGAVTGEFYVELATTQAEQKRGLMHRPKLAEGWGMLFIFDAAQKRNFFMKNTLIPLDMIFMAPNGEVVHVVHKAEPQTTRDRSSRKPAQYVLEVNGGVAKEKDIDAGDWMTVENVPKRYKPGE